MNPAIIEKKIEKLSPELQQEVVDFIDFLISKKNESGTINKDKFKFNWAKGLSDLKDKYTSVDLQHKSMDWR